MHNHELNTEIYGLRMLIFIEAEPQSNKYFQVMPTPEQYKKVSGAISTPTGKKDGIMEETTTRTSEETYDLPDLREMEE